MIATVKSSAAILAGATHPTYMVSITSHKAQCSCLDELSILCKHIRATARAAHPSGLEHWQLKPDAIRSIYADDFSSTASADSSSSLEEAAAVDLSDEEVEPAPAPDTAAGRASPSASTGGVEEDSELPEAAVAWMEQSLEALNALQLPQAALINAVDRMINELRNIRESKQRVYRPHSWTRSQPKPKPTASDREFRPTNANAVRRQETKPVRPNWNLQLMRADTIRTRTVRPKRGMCLLESLTLAA